MSKSVAETGRPGRKAATLMLVISLAVNGLAATRILGGNTTADCYN